MQAVQRGIETAMLHLQNVIGIRADRLTDPVPVLRAPLQRLQNQQVEGPL
jgi:hypothetical protein